MKRVISLFLPTWPTDRLRRKLGRNAPPPDMPTVLFGREGNRRVVKAANITAQRQGIAIGMAATRANLLARELYSEEMNADADRHDLAMLAQWALHHYSPIVAVDGADSILIDASGCAHLFGGETPMLEEIARSLKTFDIHARLAIAPTYAAAWAFSHYGDSSQRIVQEEMLASALDSLPIAALRLPRFVFTSLIDLGFDTIGEVRRQPPSSFTLRFGPEVGRKLNYAFGQAMEFIDPITPPEAIVAIRNFAEPISAPETLQCYIAQLTEQLCIALEAKKLGARSLDMLFYRVDNRIEAIRVSLAKPMHDAQRLQRLFCDKLETVDPGFGIDLMRLCASWTEPLKETQKNLSFDQRRDPDLSSLIDTLGNRIGLEHIYKMTPVESEVPERSVKRSPPLAPVTPAHMEPWPRPVRLFPRPERIQTIAMLPDHPPVSFTWRGIRHKVRQADGPERIFGEWWKRDAEFEAARDYFQLEDESGARFWVFRAGDGVLQESGSQEWFIHGLFA